MDKSTNDAGTIQTLLDRLNQFRLPRVLAIKDKVDAGNQLSDSELTFLQDVIEEARGNEKLLARNPQVHQIVTRLVSLYDEITRKALENEQKK